MTLFTQPQSTGRYDKKKGKAGFDQQTHYKLIALREPHEVMSVKQHDDINLTLLACFFNKQVLLF